MCYKACFYNGGHGRKKTDTLIIFARAYRDGKRKEPIRKQQTENKKRRKNGRQTCKLAKLAASPHPHTCAYIIMQQNNMFQNSTLFLYCDLWMIWSPPVFLFTLFLFCEIYASWWGDFFKRPLLQPVPAEEQQLAGLLAGQCLGTGCHAVRLHTVHMFRKVSNMCSVKLVTCGPIRY